MSHERTPLFAQVATPLAFPPLQGEKQVPPPYGIVRNTQEYDPQTQNRFSGIATTPVLAIVAIVVAMVLIFGVTLNNSPEENQLFYNVLQQSEQSGGASSNVNIDTTDYKDITIPQGRLRGFTKRSRQERDYTAYYKVPYAEPPLGELRFKDPISPRSGWQGLRSIPNVAPQCIQKEKYTEAIRAVGEEDCLYANIYVPVTSQEPPTSLPVMVYTHGGPFVEGNGSRYGAEYFMDEDVILITYQWRLGALGFLNTNDDVIHGNMGLKDQVQMLVWTRDNIDSFGGDPNRVTIFGNSGGSFCISLLMLSPMAKGLFHRAISQSGANTCLGGATTIDPQMTVQEVGRVLSCDAGNSTAFLECLRTKDAAEIALVRTPQAIYIPSLENRTDNQMFLTDTPYNMLKSGPAEVPYIVGVVSHEWIGNGHELVMDEGMFKDLNEDFAGNGGKVLGVDMSAEELLSIKKFYFGDKDIGNSTFREAMNMMSDKSMNHCSYLSAIMHSEHSPTFLYYLSKPPAKSYADKDIEGFPAKELGMVAHGDELQYFMLYDGYPEIPNGDPEYFQFSRYLVKQWATFAATGAPSSDWEPITRQTSNYTFWFELNDTSGRTEVVRDRMDFWGQFTLKQLHYS